MVAEDVHPGVQEEERGQQRERDDAEAVLGPARWRSNARDTHQNTEQERGQYGLGLGEPCTPTTSAPAGPRQRRTLDLGLGHPVAVAGEEPAFQAEAWPTISAADTPMKGTSHQVEGEMNSRDSATTVAHVRDECRRHDQLSDAGS